MLHTLISTSTRQQTALTVAKMPINFTNTMVISQLFNNLPCLVDQLPVEAISTSNKHRRLLLLPAAAPSAKLRNHSHVSVVIDPDYII